MLNCKQEYLSICTDDANEFNIGKEPDNFNEYWSTVQFISINYP